MKTMIQVFSFCLISLSTSALFAAAIKAPHGVIRLAARPATAFELNDIEGNTFRYQPASGRWSFVHFWASWCGPCRKEIPAIAALSKRMEKQPLQIILINTSETEDTVFSFLGGIAPELNSLLDADGEVTEQWQPRGLPSTYLVDPRGRIQYVVLGGQEWNKPEYYNFLLKLVH